MIGTGAKRNVCPGSCVSTGAKFPVASVESAPIGLCSQTAASQLRDADARVTNSASCNWVILMQVSSVQFVRCEPHLPPPQSGCDNSPMSVGQQTADECESYTSICMHVRSLLGCIYIGL